MTARACEWDGCEAEVTGRSKRCPEHQAEHRRETDSARKRQARNADKCGQAASAFAAVSPDEADREAAAIKALKRASLPEDLIERTKADPGAPFEEADKLAKMRTEAPADWARVRGEFKRKTDVSLGDLERAMGNVGNGDGDGENGRPTQAGQLIAIAEAGCTLFHCGEDAFAEIENDGHCETWPVRSRGFRQWLQLRHLDEHGGAPGHEALHSARDTIEAKARLKAPACEVSRRVGAANGALYLDLCNPKWQAIEADSKGWRLVDRPSVRFIRPRTARELPTPERGGGIGDLRPFLNLTEEGFTLAVDWLLAALRNKGPYPVLVLTGEQGSAKSTCARMLRALVDPSEAPLRSVPRNEHDLFIAARNAHVLAFDNLGRMLAWLSDALCRLSTGGGYAARELYSDDEEVVISAQRPLILNGIDEVVARGDLADRAIFLTLGAIPDADREPEADLWARFEEARPRILGALLDALVEGVRRLPDVTFERLPRMADFAKWAVACEGAVFEAGAFMQAYTGNRAGAVEAVIDASPVASAIRELMQSRGPAATWEGSATELLAELGSRVDERVAKGKEWPKTARALSATVNRVSSALRPAGIKIEREKLGGGRRTLLISVLPEGACKFAPVAPIAPNPLKRRGDGGRKRAQTGAHRAQTEGADTPTGATGAMGAHLRMFSGNGKERPVQPPALPSQPPGTATLGEASRKADACRRATDGG